MFFLLKIESGLIHSSLAGAEFCLSKISLNSVLTGWEHGEFYQRWDQSEKQLPNLQVSA